MSITVAYSHKGGFWKTKYSFLSSWFGRVGRMFFSGKTESTSNPVWRHNSDDVPRTSFYQLPTGDGSFAQTIGSGISVSFNKEVSKNKIYKAFSLEGSGDFSGGNTFTVNADSTNERETSMGPLTNKGGIDYGHIGLSTTIADGSNIKQLGTINVKSGDFCNVIAVPDGTTYILRHGGIRQKRSSVMTGSVGGFSICKYLLVGISGSTPVVLTPRGEVLSLNTLSNLSYTQVNGYTYTIEELSNSGSTYLGNPGFDYLPNNITDQADSIGSTYLVLRHDGGGVSEPIPLPGDADFYKVGEGYADSGQFSKMMLLEVTPEFVNGAPPRGQFAQANIVLGSQPYELHAINLDYESTDLDHSK